MTKIGCVIVTYNRVALLRKAIDAVQKQTRRVDQIIVVDNASTDETVTFCTALASRDATITYLRLPENTGGAGGFYFGLREAYTQGNHWAWVMDDDCLPSAEALEKLLNSEVVSRYSSEIGFLCSRVDWVDGSICKMNIPRASKNWTSYHAASPIFSEVRNSSFVSVLIPREVIKNVGFPVKEFFIWFDDFEYTRRISERYKCFYVADSVVTHVTPDNHEPADYRYLNEKSIWKFKYGIRNEVAYFSSLRAGVLRGVIHLARRYYSLRAANCSYLHSAQMLFAGFRGFFFRYKKYIELPPE